MLNQKRVFVSLGASVLIFVIGSFFLLFTYRLLNSPAWMLTVMTWILIWPNLLLSKAGFPYPGRLVSLSIGPIADFAILSVLIYVALSLLMPKSPSTTRPPPPPQFE